MKQILGMTAFLRCLVSAYENINGSAAAEQYNVRTAGKLCTVKLVVSTGRELFVRGGI